MSVICETVFSFEVLDDNGRLERWSVFYDVEDTMFVAEWADQSAYGLDHAQGAATADDLQDVLGGRIPQEILAKVKACAATTRPPIHD